MNFINFVKSNPKKIIIFSLLIIIIILLVSIFSFGKLNSSGVQKVTYKTDLKGYPEVRQKIDILLQSPKVTPSLISRVYVQYKVIEDPKKPNIDRFHAISNINFYFNSLYSETNDPIFRPISKDLGDFAKDNFPKEYDEKLFRTVCQDPSCAQEPQPKEILDIISEVNNSDFPDQIKKTTAQDLLNPGFLPKDARTGKVSVYYSILITIKDLNDYSPSKANQKIADDLGAYLNKYFPTEYKNIQEQYQKAQNDAKLNKQ